MTDMEQQRWRFGIGQSAAEEGREVAAALVAGRGEEYLRGQAHAVAIEAETARRHARHPVRLRAVAAARERAERTPLAAYPSPEQVEAAMTRRGSWTRATLALWGVPWPAPKGWRQDLERMRVGEMERRPRGWSSPVTVRRAA